MLKRKLKEEPLGDLRRTITARIFRDEKYYVAECFEIAVATQGRTLEETLANLKDAVALYFEGEDLKKLGFAVRPTVIVTMELEPAFA